MAIEPATSGEKIIQLEGKIDVIDGKVTYVVESLERIITAFEKLESTRLADHETRISKIEKWQSEWVGAHRIVVYVSLILGIIATVKAFM